MLQYVFRILLTMQSVNLIPKQFKMMGKDIFGKDVTEILLHPNRRTTSESFSLVFELMYIALRCCTTCSQRKSRS